MMKKRTCRSNADRISDLPGNVIDNILTKVPMRDAVKTSVLSKKWRYKWVYLPEIRFTETDFGKFGSKDKELDTYRLLLAVFEVLLRLRGPLRTFSLSIPWLKTCREIDQIIHFLSGKGIQNLHLHLSGNAREIPSYLFSCLELRCLRLSCYGLVKPPSTFRGFSRLTCLELIKVAFLVDFNSFLKKFPLLERLKVHQCYNLEQVYIVAPNLICFDFHGVFSSLHFNDCPLLERLKLDIAFLSDSEPWKNIIEIISELPGLKTLYISLFAPRFKATARDSAPDMLSVAPNHLECLALQPITLPCKADVLAALCLIRSSPNLRKLCVEINATSLDEIGVGALEPHGFSLNQLLEVEIIICNTAPYALEIVGYLLLIASMLTKMVIMFRNALSAEEVYAILNKVLEFQRAFPKGDHLDNGMGSVSSYCADRISNLPGDLIEIIVAHMPFTDAVKTSVLSTKWTHYKWKYLPALVFDRDLGNVLPEKPISTVDELLRFMSQVLMVHRGLLRSFTLSIPQLKSIKCLRVCFHAWN